MVALWWLYFEHSDQHQGVRPRSLFLFIHAHAFLFGSLIFLSVGYKLILEVTKEQTGLAFVFAGVVGIILSLGVIRTMLDDLKGRKLIITALLTISLGIFGIIGWLEQLVIETVVVSSFFFLLVAFLDYRNFFSKVSHEIEKLN